MEPVVPTVVVVDDAPDVRVLVRTRLRLSGRFQVVGEGSSGTDAIQLAAEHRPALLLLDVSMPGMDGLEALPQALAASPATRVVMYSGFDEQGLGERSRELGAAAFVEKSTPVEELVDVLLAVLEDQPPAPATAEVAADPSDDALHQHVLDEHVERFRQVFEQAAIGMATLTLTGHIVRANEELARLLAHRLDALVGVQYGELLRPEDAAQVSRALLQVVDGGEQVVHVEHELPGGRRVRATLAPVRDKRGRPLYLFAQVQDVTAQRAAEEHLRQSEQRFRLLVDSVQDYAIFMLDPQGHVASWNAGAQRSKGYVAEEIIGRHFRVFYPPEVAAAGHPEHELEWALRDGSYEEEGWRIRKDGTRFWANVVITAVHDEDGELVGFAKVTRDTTERRLLREEQERISRRLEQAAADQAKFLAVTAHELRTPITVLTGSADMLSKHWAEMTEPERQESLDLVGSNARRLRRLLADLLTVARLDADAVTLRAEPVDVGRLLEAAAAAGRNAVPEAKVEVDVPEPLTVVGDGDRLAQALDNLVANALRHGSGPVRLSAERADDCVELRVVDGGAGVSPDVVGRLFERFATGESKDGTGLGLYIVRELARAHGGEARYELPTAERPSGAFVLSIPAQDKSAKTLTERDTSRDTQ